MKKIKITLAIVISFIMVLVAAVGIYASDYYRADSIAVSAIKSNSDVTVTQDDNICVFSPDKAEYGLIFYPGGKVEYTAYAPLLSQLAQKGILCVLVEMPLNLAVFDINAAEDIFTQFPVVTKWYISGHSLGGSMAASFAQNNTDKLDGIVLLASYSTADLSESGLNVISVYGSNDGVLDMEKYKQYKPNLPSSAVEEVIDGGCHAYFGNYGFQDGDGNPTVSREEQISKTVEIITQNILKQ